MSSTLKPSLTLDPLGYDRCVINRQPPSGFSKMPNGLTFKLEIGGTLKGPEILPKEISLSSFFWTSENALLLKPNYSLKNLDVNLYNPA
ncbi:hypothetical protein DPMN_172770 [Dreissena polymorpha]|uniref:Uncharacterized protein n=1 Tax=Dreissena polymorpha TaxID=45954 RepID=A0A9D4E1G9_DREPO|nr:hypothetical protein DPMN_172770 [Dreissena polymorpha]